MIAVKNKKQARIYSGNKINREVIKLHSISEKIYLGDEKDFENIVNENKLAVYSTVLANLNTVGEVDDIVQETFIYAYYNFQTLRDRDKITHWLCGIARNKSRTFNKSRKNLTAFDDTMQNGFETSSVEDIYIENYERGEIMREIYKLSDKLRETVILYYIGEKPIKEISQILEIPEGTVKFRLAEARKKLKKELVNIMSNEKKEIAVNELYAKIQKNIDTAKKYSRESKKKEASDLCDETFKMIENYPSFAEKAVDSDDEPKKLLYNLYHAKAEALHLIENTDEYLTKALHLAEELANKTSDWRWLANEYYYYAIRVSKKGEIDYLAKAVEYAKKTGDNKLYAMCLFWQANGDKANGLEKFQEIVSLKEDLYNRNSVSTYVLSNGYCKVLNALKNAEVDINNEIVEYMSVCPGVKYENGKALLCGEPGASRIRGLNENVIEDVFVYADFGNGIILDNNFKVGYKFEGEESSYSFKNKKFVTEIIAMNEEVSVLAGDFKGCIHVRRSETLGDSEDDKGDRAKLNRETSGIRDVLFAQNVGIVKMTFEAISGRKEHFELSEYNITNADETELIKKYLPIALGNIWKYMSFDSDGKPFSEKYEIENVFEVEYVSEEYNAISNWAYDYPKK